MGLPLLRAADPAAMRAGKEGDGVGDVLRLAETFERWRLGEAVDQLLRLTFQEEVGRRGSRRHGVDRDAAATQLLGQDRVSISTPALVAA